MQSTEFIWQNGQFIPWENAKVHVLAHGLHYGSGVFEGIRFYATRTGPAIFKLAEHVERLFYSAEQIAMQIPYSKKAVINAIIDTVRMNKITQGYIRPLVHYGYGSMKVVPSADLPVEVVIACWPWGSYLAQAMVDIKTSTYIRIHPQSTVADAKICGHYINSLLAGLAIKNTHYHEALLLDSEGYVAEGSAENIFIVKNGVVMTPPTGTILKGITRDTVIAIANYGNIPIKEIPYTREDILQADEAFFSGTAVEITPIRSLDDVLISFGQVGPITEKIHTIYQQMIYGENPDFNHHLTWVEAAAGAIV